jgi:hypothetical protein
MVKRENLYREKIIFITNRGAFFRLDKCCETINIILGKEELATYYFNTNDLNLLIDILLREAQTNASTDNRASIFRLIETIIQNMVYKKDLYKIDEVKQMTKEVI